MKTPHIDSAGTNLFGPRSNAQAWFQFAARSGFAQESIIQVEQSEAEWRLTSTRPDSFRCLTAELFEEEEEGRVRSGDHYEPLDELDQSLRNLRGADPALPLLVVLRPDRYRSRNRLWMLGEYLAERDLPMWVDLSSLHPARAADWARNIAECGLANPRTVVNLGGFLSPDDVPALLGSGAWAVWTTWEEGRSGSRIRQLT